MTTLIVTLIIVSLIVLGVWMKRKKTCVKCGATDAYIEADEGKICSRCFYSFRGEYPSAGE